MSTTSFAATELLPVDLSDDMRAAKLERLMALTGDLQQAKDDRRDSTTRYNQRIKHLEGAIKEVREETSQQVEMKPIPVEYTPDFEAGTVRKVRTDTGAVLYDRAMTEEERADFEERVRRTQGMPIEGEPVAETADKPKGKRGRKKHTEEQAAAEAVQGAPAQPEANGSGVRFGAKGGPATHRCVNCLTEFVREGYYDPTNFVNCPSCSQYTGRSLEYLHSAVDKTGQAQEKAPASNGPQPELGA